MLPDELLYERVRAGDHRAFDALYDRYERKLFGFILRYVGNREAAEEIFHETFVTVLRKAPVSFAGASFQAWIFRVARNQCLDRLRAEKRRRVPFPVEEPAGSCDLPLAEPAVLVVGAVADLPAPMRELYRLRTAGMSYQQIADALGVPLGTVKSRMHQMVAILREKVASWDASESEIG